MEIAWEDRLQAVSDKAYRSGLPAEKGCSLTVDGSFAGMEIKSIFIYYFSKQKMLIKFIVKASMKALQKLSPLMKTIARLTDLSEMDAFHPAHSRALIAERCHLDDPNNQFSFPFFRVRM